MPKINLAILSQNEKAVSETFIRAHMQLPFNNFFYYGGMVPTFLQGKRLLNTGSLLTKFRQKIWSRFNHTELALLRSLRFNKIDVALAEYGPTACHCLPVLKNLNIRLIVHFHGFDATNPETLALYKSGYLEVFSYADSIVVVSKKMIGDVVALGATRQKVIVAPCGPHDDFFTISPSFENALYLAVARFVDVKGYLFTLAAFFKVWEKEKLARLVCIGEGPQLESCRQFVKINGIEDAVLFVGAADRDLIKSYCVKAICVVQHSVTLPGGLTEGSPVSLKEAMAAGLPIVASRSGGIPDFIVHEETGFLVEEGDVNQMASYMLKLLSDKDLARKMGRNGRKNIMENFSMEQHLEIIAKAVIRAYD